MPSAANANANTNANVGPPSAPLPKSICWEIPLTGPEKLKARLIHFNRNGPIYYPARAPREPKTPLLPLEQLVVALRKDRKGNWQVVVPDIKPDSTYTSTPPDPTFGFFDRTGLVFVEAKEAKKLLYT
ncbi:MAG: hypothetical protein MMC33_009851 [Icmadophila ericetorum]|nr:hypothetical protein [Icmadophila ericetorum]